MRFKVIYMANDSCMGSFVTSERRYVIGGKNLDSLYTNAIKYIIQRLNRVARVMLHDKNARLTYLIQNGKLHIFGPGLGVVNRACTYLVTLNPKYPYKDALRHVINFYNKVERAL